MEVPFKLLHIARLVLCDLPGEGSSEKNKGGKFLKKLWCCVGGNITREFGFIN